MLEFFFFEGISFLLTVSVDVVLMVFLAKGKRSLKKKDFFQIISSLGTPLCFLSEVLF